ncbi:MAG: hypothetical protein DRI30_05070 [Chloroflexi bacterium]|nr:MAG: hypothetical protein DRI30_05070 [Chloroflexota bacterium]
MRNGRGDFNDDGSPAEKPVAAAVTVQVITEPPKTSQLGEAPESLDPELEDLLSLSRGALLEVAADEGVSVSLKATKADIIAAIQGVVE